MSREWQDPCLDNSGCNHNRDDEIGGKRWQPHSKNERAKHCKDQRHDQIVFTPARNRRGKADRHACFVDHGEHNANHGNRQHNLRRRDTARHKRIPDAHWLAAKIRVERKARTNGCQHANKPRRCGRFAHEKRDHQHDNG